MKAIINAELVMRDHLIPEAVLFVEDGKIAGFGEMRNTKVPAGCEVIDAGGLYVAPGFVDIHTHAADGVRFFNDPVRAASFTFARGTTTVLPALYFSMTVERYLWAIDVIQQAMRLPECANIAGFYMEGPYMNAKFGSDRLNNPWTNPVDRKDYQPLLEACGTDAKVWVVAPERENILQFVLDAKKANPNVRFAVGHSEATPQQVEALMPYGLCLGTHHTNATGTIQKYPECRGVCVDEAVNYNSAIYAEIICDSCGIHVDPYMQRLVRKIKGDDRIILISDAVDDDGPTPPGYEGVDDILFDHTGEIAGSKLTPNIACRNFMRHTGASIVDVFKAASYNPAHAIGMTDRGEIAVGKRADLVIVDYKMNVQGVFFNGNLQK